MPEIDWGCVKTYDEKSELSLKCHSLNFIQKEGIYFFGGKNPLGKTNNQLWCLRICDKDSIEVAKKHGNEPIQKLGMKKKKEKLHSQPVYAYFQWELVETEGKSPSERYGHCLHYHPEMNVLLIYGGCTNNKQNAVCSDIHMLRMDNLTWIKVQVTGSNLGASANFASALVNSKLIIFGGISENMWPSNHYNVIELDSDKVQSLIVKEYPKKQKDTIPVTVAYK